MPMPLPPPVRKWPWLARNFAPTRWSLVRRVAGKDRDKDKGAGTRCEDTFCRIYWYPLYTCLRSRGYSHDDAQDHVQSFLSRLISRKMLSKADAGRGRLRGFLTRM